MLSFLPASLKGFIALLLLILSTVFWCVLLYVFVILKILIPLPPVRRRISKVMVFIGEAWIAGNSFEIALMHDVYWDLQGLENLRRDQSYLITSNHQSWVDIVVLQHVFNRRIPFIRFFLKQELMYVPFLNGAWWALDFPFMKRHSPEYLAKHPEKRGEDLATTRRACDRLRGTPISILNFLEGTRFTPEKRARQASPFKYLLAPKTGGALFVIDAMGTQFDALLDVTIHYPAGIPNMWKLLSGQVDQITVRIEKIGIPKKFFAEKEAQESNQRGEMKNWLREIWVRKDRLLDELRSTAAAAQTTTKID